MRYRASALGVLFALNVAAVQAGTMGPVQIVPTEKVYFGVFGGGGSSNHVKIKQYGTAFFLESAVVEGPLAVNAFGHSDKRDVGMIGGQVGYSWQDIPFSNHPLSLSPAVELEGYYLGKSSFRSDDVINITPRLSEHDFHVTYPLKSGVFLVNSVLNFSSANYARWRPYVGAGIGAAVLSISHANSLQTEPLEAGINHYNGNTSDKLATFAAQAKVGLNFAFSEHLSVFGEYRWLYMADTKFLFGSTIYPNHAATSSWTANLGSQNYNLGAAGIRYAV